MKFQEGKHKLLI